MTEDEARRLKHAEDNIEFLLDLGLVDRLRRVNERCRRMEEYWKIATARPESWREWMRKLWKRQRY